MFQAKNDVAYWRAIEMHHSQHSNDFDVGKQIVCDWGSHIFKKILNIYAIKGPS